MIELKNITKVYELNRHDKVIALENVNLAIEEGELIVLKGASGSGKSTILSLIAALSRYYTDRVIPSLKMRREIEIYRRASDSFLYSYLPSIAYTSSALSA